MNRRQSLGTLLALLVATLPSAARASGESDATIISNHYRLRISSGVRKTLAHHDEAPEPKRKRAPGDVPDCPEFSYWEQEEREYVHRLGPYVPVITKKVDAAAKRLNLAPFDLMHPELPGAVLGEKLEGDDVYRRPGEEAAAKAWLNGTPGRAGLVYAYARVRGGGGPSGEPLSLVLAVTKPVERKALDALAAEVANAIGKAPAPPAMDEVLKAGPPCNGMVPTPWPKTLVETKTTFLYRPGLRVRVGKAASGIDAPHAAWWEAQQSAFAARAEAAFVAEVKTHAAALGLPPDWPASSAGALTAEEADKPPKSGKAAPALYATFAAFIPEVSIKAPLRREPPKAIADGLFKSLYHAVGPPDPSVAPVK